MSAVYESLLGRDGVFTRSETAPAVQPPITAESETSRKLWLLWNTQTTSYGFVQSVKARNSKKKSSASSSSYFQRPPAQSGVPERLHIVRDRSTGILKSCSKQRAPALWDLIGFLFTDNGVW